jgi:hypothetical protein
MANSWIATHPMFTIAQTALGASAAKTHSIMDVHVVFDTMCGDGPTM